MVAKNRVFDHFFCTFKALYSLRSETNQKIPPTFFVDLLKTNQKMYNLSLLSLKPRKLLNKNWFFKPYPTRQFFIPIGFLIGFFPYKLFYLNLNLRNFPLFGKPQFFLPEFSKLFLPVRKLLFWWFNSFVNIFFGSNFCQNFFCNYWCGSLNFSKFVYFKCCFQNNFSPSWIPLASKKKKKI